MQQNCGSCYGTGKTTCPGCNGRRHISRLTINGEVEISTCLVCAGTGKVNCNFCRGSGKIEVQGSTSGSQTQPHPTKRKVTGLEGKWMGNDGGWYEFKKGNGNYIVTSGNGSAVMGNGTAIMNNCNVYVNISFPIVGTINLEFLLTFDELICYVDTMGMRIPVSLYPV